MLAVEILKEPVEHATASKQTTAAVAVAAKGRFPMKTVAESDRGLPHGPP
jgi:hypothetical protein